MKPGKLLLTIIFLLQAQLWATEIPEGVEYSSKIEKALLYQNQAKITRLASVKLNKGQNQLIFTGLPPALLDWSVRGRLPQDFKGSILSIEVEQKALVEKRKGRITDLENKIKSLKEKDGELLDSLRNIDGQNTFLDSILKFSQQAVAKELTSGLPQVKVWDATLNYVNDKKLELNKQKRQLELKREEIGKDIQQLEFDLSRIAGHNYFGAYQKLSNEAFSKRSSHQVQEFSNSNSIYSTKKNLFENPDTAVETEKRVIVSVVSPRDIQLNFEIEYLIGSTNWNMIYDIRADQKERSVNMTMFGNIYQRTGEDWQNITLELSTGAPANSITQANLPAWYLSIYKPYVEGSSSSDKRKYSAKPVEEMKQDIYKSSSGKENLLQDERDEQYMQQYKQEVVVKGVNFNITLALKQNIENSVKRQKKFVQEHTIADDKNVEFYYEVLPQVFDKSYIKAKLINNTKLPWLAGEAQLFLDNEFMGKAQIPYTPIGKKQDVVLGIEDRVTAKKILEKKFEDTAGVFSGSRRIRYDYVLQVENLINANVKINLRDHLPYSQDSKLKVELDKLDLPFSPDEEKQDGEKLKDLSYNSGLRNWVFTLNAKGKKEIKYSVVITFDKEYEVSGLK